MPASTIQAAVTPAATARVIPPGQWPQDCTEHVCADFTSDRTRTRTPTLGDVQHRGWAGARAMEFHDPKRRLNGRRRAPLLRRKRGGKPVEFLWTLLSGVEGNRQPINTAATPFTRPHYGRDAVRAP